MRRIRWRHEPWTSGRAAGPLTVRALVTDADAPGGIVLRDAPDPEPAAHEALVAVRATSLNRGEVRGLASAKPGSRPGWDLAGEVVRPAADGTGPREGTRVVGVVSRGAWAELVAVPTSELAAIPEQLSFDAAATLPVAGLTALWTLRAGELVDDRRVLVTGAAGGVGRFAVQLAAHEGAAVTGVVGSPERGEGLEALGAAELSVGFPSGREFDLVLESVGGSSLAAALGSVAPRGVIVSFGNSSGEPTTFDASAFYRRNGARLHAFVLFPELERTKLGTRDLGFLAGLVATGRLSTEVGAVASWHDADDAIAALLGRQIRGKAVLRFD